MLKIFLLRVGPTKAFLEPMSDEDRAPVYSSLEMFKPVKSLAVISGIKFGLTNLTRQGLPP